MEVANRSDTVNLEL